MPALNRKTTESVKVVRYPGKIAIEEAVGSPCFMGHNTYPPSDMITGLSGLPFSKDFMDDVNPRLDDVEARLNSMDQSGVDYAVVSLTSPGIEGVFDKETAVEFARKTNDDMHAKYAKAHPSRFGFFACVPMQDPVRAAAELERAVTQLGAKGVLINGFSNLDINDHDSIRYLDDPACEPFWAKLAELDVPLYLHPRPPSPGQQRLYHGYPNLGQASYAFQVETAGHALRIMCSGILDRYPSVNIILGHAAEALPFFIHRADHREAIGVKGANGPHEKSMMYYLQNNFYATLAGVRRESALKCSLEEMGESRVLFSVDYPYESNEDAADWFDGLAMSASTRNALAKGNAERLLKLK